MIISPTTRAYDADRRTIRVVMPDGSDMPGGEYWVRGAVCWPREVVRPSGDVVAEGFALLLAQSVRTRCAYVVEDHVIQCIDPIIDDGGRIVYAGSAGWFNDCWARWYCKTFFINETPETHYRYALQVWRSPMLTIKPGFIEVDWRDVSAGMVAVIERLQAGKLLYNPGSLLEQQITVSKPDKPSPGAWALMAAINGMEQQPWREP